MHTTFGDIQFSAGLAANGADDMPTLDDLAA